MQLYLDQFRDFHHTFIPLKQVNFLVGENSTGKTSVMKLLHILQSSNFWINNKFYSDEVQLGSFREIVSPYVQAQQFTVGMQSEEGEIQLMRFIDREGQPYLSEFSSVIEEQLIKIIRGEEAYYDTRSLAELIEDEDLENDEFFRQWVELLIRDDSIFQSSGQPSKPDKSFKQLKQGDGSEWVGIAVLVVIVATVALIGEIGKARNERSEESPSNLLEAFNYPHFHKDSTWIAPIRQKPKRIYDPIEQTYAPDGGHIPNLIKQLFDKDTVNGLPTQSIIEKISSFGQACGLFERINISSTENILQDGDSPFQIEVTIGGQKFNLINVGYGVSQVLPVLTEVLIKAKGALFEIQQPEIHLHPKAQAALGSFFYDVAKSDQKQFLIETHSDYLIDRFRYQLMRDQGEKVEAQILFFERTPEGNCVTPIPILPDGSYPDDQPEAFRAFFIQEALKMMDL